MIEIAPHFLMHSNHVYKRSLIHDEYGGSRQGGISPSARNGMHQKVWGK